MEIDIEVELPVIRNDHPNILPRAGVSVTTGKDDECNLELAKGI
jgi:hypothetical protein